jgi:hypothetical protein
VSAQDTFGANPGRRFDQNTYLGTHNAYANSDQDYRSEVSNQDESITDQLDDGVRYVNLDLWIVKQKKVALTWQSRIYDSSDDSVTTLCCQDWGNVDKEVIVAHDPHKWQYFLLKGFNSHWPTLDTRMSEIQEWLASHPSAVVTVAFEDQVSSSNHYLVDNVIATAEDAAHGMGLKFFRVSGPNPGLQAEDGSAWDVDKHGFPQLDQMVASGYRLVLLWGGDAQVRTTYGDDSLFRSTWTEYRSGRPIDDWSYPLYLFEHAPDSPKSYSRGGDAWGWTADDDDTALAFGINNYSFIATRINKLFDLYQYRLPTFVAVDSFKEGGSGGPRQIVRNLNADRDALTDIDPLSYTSVLPPATAYGWRNTPLTVLFGNGGQKATLWNSYGDQNNGMQVAGTSPLVFSGDQETTLSSAAVGFGGNRSKFYLTAIRIDTLAPTISGAPSRAANAFGWYKSNLDILFAAADRSAANFKTSGLASATSPIHVTQEGANQSFTGTAVDKAGNTTSTTVDSINLDKTLPTVTYTGNAGSYTVDQYVNITCTPFDALSGIQSNTCQNIVGDAFTFNVGSAVDPGQNSFSATATDKADNVGSNSTSFTVISTPGSLSNLTRRFVTNAGVANSLVQKLDSVARAQNAQQKAQHVSVYLNELAIQTGKFVSPTDAATLARLARLL